MDTLLEQTYVFCAGSFVFCLGALLGWAFAWHAKRTFQFEVTLVSEEVIKQEPPPAPNKETPSDINDADWWKHSE